MFILQVGADSVAAVTEATRQVAEFLGGFGLPEAVVAQVTGLLSGVPVIVLVLLTRLPVLKFLSPIAHRALDPWWNANRQWAIPVVAWGVGWLVGNSPLLGFAAVGIHQTAMGAVRALKGSSPEGLAKGRTLAIVLGLIGLLAAAPATAGDNAERRTSWIDARRFALSLRTGAEWTRTKATDPPATYVRAGLVYQLTNPLGLEAGLRRTFAGGERYRIYAEAKLVIAP